ncbi:MAG: hypothetical protein HOC71_09020 [Candidatus Latescibacteria bacterium]|jgi:hypothetical protein|nr:hypothetical protein [Candidatus Latescibacterota bacterium]
MKDHTRAYNAYIVGSLITGFFSSSIYDLTNKNNYSMRGEADTRGILIYAYEKGCYITGNLNSGGYLFYNYDGSYHIRLNIDNNKFEGSDFSSNCEFKGEVTDYLISLYDSAENRYFEYKLDRKYSFKTLLRLAKV